ncbi:hypothetical protein J4558_25870 [Leptolyngbya sp. 15MV]|nr:hypothetical protein J4558_25870 [Leptolyngbya sp. 15MV]
MTAFARGVWVWEEAARYSSIAAFAWLLHDFRSLRRQTRAQGGFNRKGVIAADKATRKLGFAALAACFRRLRAARG